MIKLYYTFEKCSSEGFIKEALERFTGKNGFNIKRTANGKPYAQGESVYFSLSHTDSLIICAVSNSEIGLDAEKIRPIKDKGKILRRFMGDNTDSVTDTEFLKKWTAFESRVKYFGEKIIVCPQTKSTPLNVETILFDEYVVSICSDSHQRIELIMV